MEGRVLLVDNHRLLGQSLAALLREKGCEVEVIDGVVRDFGEIPAMVALAVAAGRPSVPALVGLVDLNLAAELDGVEVIRLLARHGLPAAVLSGVVDRLRLGGAIAAGARAVLGKDAPLEDVLAVVDDLLAGREPPGRRQREELREHYLRDQRTREPLLRKLARLTSAEQEVLWLLAHGLDVHGIALERVVSETTVRSQVRSILLKLEVHSQQEAVTLVHRSRWRPSLGSLFPLGSVGLEQGR
ncbi:LuxR C-terminal-related transcriptional regulator [Aciditerrimonas ferrireducens]|uniref:LuxR C-terminal-related transcriptional regulator n=1 Tax=Aciditerrimonas ferrireducens TaxID=667306 RepID=UPI00200415D4|nr:response regulator transcription factor [Aciditerrimonas ferrireducens]MCK4176290.1 response regulator transcription factor [Aciditerrimonas ferrireducens]